MYFKRKATFSIRTFSLYCFAILLFSCNVVRNYPVHTPFVFENRISLKGNISKDERKKLTEDLSNYWDDSLKAIKVQEIGFIYKLRNPPVFDSNNIIRSKNFMNAYLNSQGYYYASFKPSHHFDTVRNQIRTTVAFDIAIGKSILIDSIAYNMIDTSRIPIDSTLQNLTLLQTKNSLLRAGKAYTKESVNSELDRLLSWYHQNGYYRFTRDNIYALIDTLDNKFLTLTLDPFQQARLIEEAAKKRKENPGWGITIGERIGKDSFATQQFYVGNLYYYPDLSDTYNNIETILKRKDFFSASEKEMTMFYNEDKFRFRPLREHTFIHNGDLYNEESYFKSINRLSQIGAWKQVEIKSQIRGKDSIDFYFFMVPEKKQGFTIDQELSRNTGDIGSGNLLGIATNFTYKNRNIAKQAIQSLTSLRFGVELNIDKNSSSNVSNSLLQTTQINLSHSYIFPRIIQPIFSSQFLDKLDNKKSLLTVSGAYTDRRGLYKLNSIVGNWGYQWNKGNNTWLFKPINIELYKVDTLAGLDSLFITTPFLRNSFKNGKVVGISLSFSKTFSSKRNPSINHYIRFGYEESGALINYLLPSNTTIYNYNKLEGEYRFIKKYHKDEFAARLFAGVGLHGSQSLPVFKQYFLGGPNSMRAWGLRQLGLGSSLTSDTSTSSYTDRFGDFALEMNLEYRYSLGMIAGVKIGSAVYTDIGNIWDINRQPNAPNASFNIGRLDKDLALGLGTGLRFDFSYFLIRLDWAYKLKDPAREQNNGWMDPKHFEWTSTRSNGVQVKNYAFQLGIGLPF